MLATTSRNPPCHEGHQATQRNHRCRQVAVASLACSLLLLAAGCSRPPAQPVRHADAAEHAEVSCTDNFAQRSSEALREHLPTALSTCAPGNVRAAKQIGASADRLLRTSADICAQREAGVAGGNPAREALGAIRTRIGTLVELVREASGARDDRDRARAFLAAWHYATSAEQRDELEVAVTTMVRRADEVSYHALPDGAALETGQRVKFVFRLSSPAYLYLYQGKPDGSLKTLFPQAQMPLSNPLDASEPITIPPGNSAFRVTDEHLGAETMVVAASVHPVPSLHSALPPSCDASAEGPQVVRGLADPSAAAVDSALTCAPSVEPAAGSSSCAIRPAMELPPPVAGAPVALRIRSGAGDDTVVGVLHFRHDR